MDIRRIVVVKDVVHSEAGLPAINSVTRVAACALIGNPLAGVPTDHLDLLFSWGADLGERLVKECLGSLSHPVRAYGKAAIVGADGDIEHAAALLHPLMGKPIRNGIGGGMAIIPSNAKIGAPGCSIDIPLGNKDDVWSFNEIDTITVSVGGAPRPMEILVIVALSDGGRPRPRVVQPTPVMQVPGPAEVHFGRS
jgi:hypothetical protein